MDVSQLKKHLRTHTGKSPSHPFFPVYFVFSGEQEMKYSESLPQAVRIVDCVGTL